MSNNIDVLQQKEIVAELRTTVRRTGKPTLVPYADRMSYTGFTSVYGYPKTAANHIIATESTRGLAKFPVYSDQLFVDFDDNEQAAAEFSQFLKRENYTHEMYHTGGRSVHFHVPIKPMYGAGVPDSQRVWMEEHAPQADMSIYRHAGLYRLPGTYHANNPGNRKERIGGLEGGDILTIENRPRIHIPKLEEGDDPEHFHMILGKLLNTQVDAGGRHPHAFKIVAAAKSSGKDREYAHHLVSRWNANNCHPPKGEWELEKLMRWVYGD